MVGSYRSTVYQLSASFALKIIDLKAELSYLKLAGDEALTSKNVPKIFIDINLFREPIISTNHTRD